MIFTITTAILYEALGVISGSARLKLGGHMGENIVVHAGECARTSCRYRAYASAVNC